MHLPRGQQIWNIETKGHDVFEVYSKYKSDPKDPNRLTSVTHPHLVHRFQLPKKTQNMESKPSVVFNVNLDEEEEGGGPDGQKPISAGNKD